MQPNQKPDVPAWLTELQQKSWEPEVLLSGIVLYGMLQLPDLLDDFAYFFKVNIDTSSNDIDTFVTMMKIAIHWLTGGLIAHLISRGIWVGMVGLSFTFPKGIVLDQLKLTDKYKTFLSRIPDTEQIILRLESFCSSLFSISFMMFMMMMGVYFFLLVTIILPVLGLVHISTDVFDGLGGQLLKSYLLLMLIAGLLGFIDFVTLGFFKRFKWISKIYWPIYRLVGVLTLARFYRPIYYILVSNISRWKIALAIAAFAMISFWSIGNNQSQYAGEDFSQINLWSDNIETGAFTGYYDDQNDDIKSVVASIQSDVIQGNTLRLFIVLRANREDSIKAYCNLDSLLKIEDMTSSRAKLQCISAFYTVAIDDSVIADLPYKFHYKTKTKQRGILTYVDVSSLKSGLHHLTLSMPESMYDNPEVAKIPFYREESVAPYYVPVSTEEEEREKDSYLKLKPILPK